jgi:UDP-galactopyranose mutase
MNYPNSNNFTRITEMGHMTGQLGTFTTVAIEYPCAHTRGLNIPYYPIPRDENQALHARYLDFARQEAGNVDFLGRLGDYKYYNMDQATGRALAFFRKLRERVA